MLCQAAEWSRLSPDRNPHQASPAVSRCCMFLRRRLECRRRWWCRDRRECCLRRLQYIRVSSGSRSPCVSVHCPREMARDGPHLSSSLFPGSHYCQERLTDPAVSRGRPQCRRHYCMQCSTFLRQVMGKYDGRVPTVCKQKIKASINN